MTTIKVNFFKSSTPGASGLSGFNEFSNSSATGVLSADLLNELGASTGISLSVGSAGFTGGVGSSTIADDTPDPEIPVGFFYTAWYGGTGEALVLSGFAPNQSYTLGLAGHNSGRDTRYSATNSSPATADYIVASDPDPDPWVPTDLVYFTGTANGSGEIVISLTIIEVYTYLNGFILDYTAASSPIITNIDTDNAVNQYQQCNANGVSGLSGPVTSGTLGGQAVTIVDGDWQANAGVVALGLPGNLATGTYSLVLSDGTNSATLTGVSYTQTHARPAFDGLVDSNSILSGQSYTANTYFRFVTSFSNGTLDTAAGDAAEWAGDIADYYTPNEGFTGDDTASIEFLYSDGTTSSAVGVTVTVAPATDTTPDQFDLGANVTGAEPGATTQRTFVLAGIDAGETVSVTATGSATVSPSTAQVGDTITVELTAGTFEAVVSGGVEIGGVSDSFNVTSRAAVLPTQDATLPDLSLGETDAVSIDLDNYFSGASSYTLTGLPAGSGLSFSGSVLSGNVNKDDIAGSPYTLTATAFSADGSINDAFSVTVVDDIAPVISISPLTTLDTTPIVSGSAGDATSLTLVVNGVTYNPTPSGGAWSQQLPTLALGDYTMTLNGEDASGNAATQAQATLSVVEEIVNTGRRIGFLKSARGSARASIRESIRS